MGCEPRAGPGFGTAALQFVLGKRPFCVGSLEGLSVTAFKLIQVLRCTMKNAIKHKEGNPHRPTHLPLNKRGLRRDGNISDVLHADSGKH